MLLVGAVFFGLVVLALFIGLGLLAWVAFNLRLWWLRRKMRNDRSVDREAAREGQVIDADYEVVSRKEEE